MRRQASGDQNLAAPAWVTLRRHDGRRMKLAWSLHELSNPTPRGLKLALVDFGQMVFLHQAQGFTEVARVGKLGRA